MAALEQEIASVIRFILDSVPGITPYYWDIPEGFVVPSVFFPQPELTPLGDTFASYAVEYDWYIKFFASTDEDAYASAAAALNTCFTVSTFFFVRVARLVTAVSPAGA